MRDSNPAFAFALLLIACIVFLAGILLIDSLSQASIS